MPEKQLPDPSFLSFCTQGLPGVAESSVSSSNGKPSPWEEDDLRTDEGKWFMRLFSDPEVSGHGWMRDPTD